MDNKTQYEEDFYLWIRTTINQLQARQFERVDLENLLTLMILLMGLIL